MGNLGRHYAAACGLLLACVTPGISQELQLNAPVVAAPAPAVNATFVATSPEQLQAARAKLQEDMARLNRTLGSGANGQAWRKFLMWEELETQLAPDAVANAAVLEDVRHRFISGHPGLKMPAFAAVARSVAVFEQAALAADPKAPQEAAARFQALAALSATPQEPLGPQMEAAAAAVRWLALRGQAPEMVQAARKQYGQPNFFFHMSEPFLAIGMERKVNRTEPVTDVILGTRIRGTGTTSGYVSTQLVPNPNRAVIDNVFNGTTHSRTVGRNGPATIHSAGVTTFEVRKRVYMDPDGLKTLPATATARTSTRTLGVDSGRGGWLFGHIADSIAAKRVAQSKSRGEAIGADHAEDRLIRRVEQDANPELVNTNKDYYDRVRYPLLENGQFPPDMRLRSTDYYIYGLGTEANRLQLGAPDKPVPLRFASDLGGQVHQSALNNLADGSLAGDTVSQTDFENWVKDLMGRLPKRFERGPDEDVDWIITFAPERPVRISFGDNEITIVLNTIKLEGRTESDTPWLITGRYRIEPIPGGLKAVRQGEIDVWPSEYPRDAENLPNAIIARIPNIRRQFEKGLFEPELIHDGLELTGDWEKAGKIPLVEYFCRAGWVNLAWRLP